MPFSNIIVCKRKNRLFKAKGMATNIYASDSCIFFSTLQCPRGERVMPGGTVVPAEPFGNEAHSFVKEMILQREVDIQVEGMDKGGNFIGWCFEGSTNLSLALVDEGFASSFIMGDKSGYGNQIIMAEEAAKKKKIKR